MIPMGFQFRETVLKIRDGSRQWLDLKHREAAKRCSAACSGSGKAGKDKRRNQKHGVKE